MTATPVRLDLVLADWCPHCVPLSTERAARLAKHLQIPLRRFDIDDPEQERQADAMVAAFGDWDPDYLIPQVFVEWSDGRVEHVLTGVPGDPADGTRAGWDRLDARFASKSSP